MKLLIMQCFPASQLLSVLSINILSTLFSNILYLYFLNVIDHFTPIENSSKHFLNLICS